MLFALPFILMLCGLLILVFPPTRRFLFFLLGRQISKAAQQGRMRMEVRTWKFGSPHFDKQETAQTPKQGSQQIILDTEFVPVLKDVTKSDDERPRS